MTPKLKIVFLINELTVGGAEKLVFTTAKHLDRKRFEPIMISFRKSTGRSDDMTPEISKAGIAVHCLEMKHYFDISGLLRLVKILNKEKPQILHTHLYYSDFFGRLIGKLCGVPVIISTVHMLEKIRYNRLFQWVDRETSKLCNGLIAVTEHTRQGLQSVEGISTERVTVIPNAIENTVIVSEDIKGKKRRELGIPESAFVAGIVSRLEGPRKGHRTLLQSVQKLLPKIPNLFCLIIGDGPDRQALETLTHQMSLENHVLFTGNRHDVTECLQAFDLFVLPSYLEGMPIVLLEAMAAKLPIITTPVGGVPEFIIHNETGILVTPGNTEELNNAIEDLYQNSERRKHLSEKTFSLFTEKYDMRQSIKISEKYYKKLWDAVSNPKIKILMVATAFDTGGVTTYLANLISHLPENNFELSLASGPENFRGDLLNGLGIRHYPAALQKPLHPVKDLQAFFQLYSLIRKHHWDIVHTHNSKADFIAGLAAKAAGIPVIVSTGHGAMNMGPQSSLRQRFFDFLELIAYRFIHHHVISVSEATTASLLQKKKVRPDHVTTITNGIEILKKSDSARNTKRKELGLNDSDAAIFSVMRFKYPKTPEILIKSISQINSSHPNTKCFLVGDGPDKSSLEQLIKQTGLEKHVVLLGERQDAAELLQAADIFVLSTLSEGTSMSLLEAMGAGLPCIASEVGGNVNLIQNKLNGLLVPANDVESLTATLQLLLQSQDLRVALGNAAQVTAKKDFALPVQAEKTYRLLETLSSQSRHSSRFERFKYYAREEGYQHAIGKVIKKLVSPLFLKESLWFLTAEDSPIGILKSRIPVTIRLATEDDVSQMQKLIFMSISEIKEMLSKPYERCYVAEFQGQIIAMQWIHMGGSAPFKIDPFGYSFQLSKEDAYFHDSRTLREYRGQGVMNELQLDIYHRVSKEGFKRIFTDILVDNETSLGLLEKIGLEKFERVTFTRILGFSFAKSNSPRSKLKSKSKVLIFSFKENSADWIPYLSSSNTKNVPIETGRSITKYWKALAALIFMSIAEKPAIIHLEEIDYLFLAAALILKTPHITLRHQEPVAPSSMFPKLKAALLKRADIIFYQDEKAALPRGDERWQALNASLSNTAPDNIAVANARTDLKLSPDCRTVGTLMPLSTSVNPWNFITFCEKFYATDPKTQFLLVGDGPLFLSLKLHAEKLPLKNKIRILKHCERKKLIEAVDIFVTASPTEENALAALEARASSKQVMGLSHDNNINKNFDSSSLPQNLKPRHLALQIQAKWAPLMSNDMVRISSKHWRK